jgi:hypothetical protein
VIRLEVYSLVRREVWSKIHKEGKGVADWFVIHPVALGKANITFFVHGPHADRVTVAIADDSLEHRLALKRAV